ncbi:hypothetical protein J9978_21600 [Chromobacterium violaceum]|uniref:hypothetical protein n=1 Tax=Chromobacterium violaceum TaxID=536 RepID=UPI00111C134C|nr:hypothetical protein [Chromobacterium violaceum]MBP4052073.1 hypothetical protein [Chromobacterium violaceum]
MHDFYEKLYLYELSVKEQIVQRLQLTLAFFFPLVGVVGYLLLNVKLPPSLIKFPEICFWILMIIAGYHIWDFFYYYKKAWHGWSYSYIPFASEISQYEKKVVEHFRSHCNDDAEEIASDYLTNEVIPGYYVEAADRNAKENEVRSQYLHKSNRSLTISTYFVIFGLLVFLFADLSKPVDVSVVKPVVMKVGK